MKVIKQRHALRQMHYQRRYRREVAVNQRWDRSAARRGYFIHFVHADDYADARRAPAEDDEQPLLSGEIGHLEGFRIVISPTVERR